MILFLIIVVPISTWQTSEEKVHGGPFLVFICVLHM